MLRKLRIKITATTIISMIAVLTVIGGALIFGVYINFSHNTDKILRYIADNDGIFPSSQNTETAEGSAEEDIPGGDYASGFGFGMKFTAETPYETRYFTVRLAKSGEVIFADVSHIAEVSAEKAGILARKVNILGKESGMLRQYRYLKQTCDNGERIIFFINCTTSLRWISSLVSLLFTTMIFVLLITSLLVWLASEGIVETFYVNLENQKKFITNASHEIKTPIAIIDANAEVLKYTTGENEWIASIQNQTKRLSKLTKRLVALSKAEESSVSGKMERFSLSDAVCDTAHSLKPSAESRALNYNIDIEHGVYMKGDEGSIRQMAEVLIENAVKYCSDGGEVRIKLYTKGRSIYFETYNDCPGVDNEKLSKLFDRFYRADDSRSRETGGFGIGLSIAKAVVATHKGKIYAECENDHSITFVAVF